VFVVLQVLVELVEVELQEEVAGGRLEGEGRVFQVFVVLVLQDDVEAFVLPVLVDPEEVEIGEGDG
jgi:hypothetical protein